VCLSWLYASVLVLLVDNTLVCDSHSICVPRKAQEAAGAIVALTHTDGSSLIINVEYNQVQCACMYKHTHTTVTLFNYTTYCSKKHLYTVTCPKLKSNELELCVACVTVQSSAALSLVTQQRCVHYHMLQHAPAMCA
jgi:hypothetical protein